MFNVIRGKGMDKFVNQCKKQYSYWKRTGHIMFEDVDNPEKKNMR